MHQENMTSGRPLYCRGTRASARDKIEEEIIGSGEEHHDKGRDKAMVGVEEAQVMERPGSEGELKEQFGSRGGAVERSDCEEVTGPAGCEGEVKERSGC